MAYPHRPRPLQFGDVSPGIDRTRTLRGAACGAVAAAVWGLQQPLDKLAFSSRYDDVELLGKGVTRGDAWYPIGFALHMGNGAAFGAALRQRRAGAADSRGPPRPADGRWASTWRLGRWARSAIACTPRATSSRR